MGQEGLENVILRHTDPHKPGAVQEGSQTPGPPINKFCVDVQSP